ncbi:MAG: class I SAM-dependent methyltransferase [Dehalococcoidia bacterium]|nr:class I SAM-dependent methyltransferase [Dehalococcoidia bacterium]
MKSYKEYSLLRLRDRFGIPFKPERELPKLAIGEGQQILDYGCGSGCLAFPAAGLVGKRGRVCALDQEPLAIAKIRERAEREGRDNIHRVLSDLAIGLPDEAVNVVLLYGVLREIRDKESLVRELCMVLKPDGYLSTRYCLHISKGKILEVVEAAGLFRLRQQNGHVLNFEKTRPASTGVALNRSGKRETVGRG